MFNHLNANAFEKRNKGFSEHTGVSLSNLRIDGSRGRGLPYIKLGKKVIYYVENIDAFRPFKKKS